MRNLLLVAGVMVSLSANAESWICLPDSTAGFSYVEKSDTWESIVFRPGMKYVVRPPLPADGNEYALSKWVVVATSYQSPLTACAGFNSDGYLKCDGLVTFEFHKPTLKFSVMASFPYFVKSSKGKWEDVIAEIGHCTAI